MDDLLGSEEHDKIIQDFFGFRENPFGVTPDPRYFFDHALYLEGLSRLVQGIHGKKGIMLLTGEGGTGKTTLLRKLMRHLPTKFILAQGRHLTANSMLEMMVRELDLGESGDGLQMMQQLESFLLGESRQKRTVALLIDEAQELSDDALQGLCDLSNLETDKEKLLQIVLAGQPELAQNLAKPSLQRVKQRIALHYRLEKLGTLKDLVQYVTHRLEIAGHSGQGIFEPDAIDAVWGYTGGTLRVINTLCDNSLTMAAAAGRKKLSAPIIEKAASLLMLERKAELPPDSQAAEGPAPKQFAAQPAEKKLQNDRGRAMATASSEAPPQPPNAQPEADFAASPAAQIATSSTASEKTVTAPDRSDLERLKAAMAAIRLPAPIEESKESASTKNPRPGPSQAIPPRVDLNNSAATGSVPPPFFDYMVHEATEALGPIGEFVVQEQIAAMGESRQNFPRRKLLALIESVSGEIANKQMRAKFELIMRREIRNFRPF